MSCRFLAKLFSCWAVPSVLKQHVLLIVGLASRDNHGAKSLQWTRQEKDVVCGELLCGREEILNTALKSLSDTSTG